MKVKIVLFLFVALGLTFTLSSYREGPAYWAGYDCTGATGSRFGCGGGGCHRATTSNALTIELDSAGVPVTSYYPGLSYTVKLSATNGTGNSLPDFGFQMASVLLSGSGTSTPTQGGTWDSTALPASVQYTIAGTCQVCSGWPIPIVEHSAAIPATSGSGGNGTTYVESIQWTAPDSGKGTVILYGVINAVNGDGSNGGDYSQVAPSDTITEAMVASADTTKTGVNALNDKLSGLNIYPALMNENVTLSFNLKESSSVTASLISMGGQTVKTFMSQESLGQGNFKRIFDVNGLAAGVYLVRVQIDNTSLVSKVVKE